MQRAVIAALASAGIGLSAGACAGQPAAQPSGARVTGTWTIASCEVDVRYVDETEPADHYVPDTEANFQQYFVPGQASGLAALAVVVTFMNNTGGPAPLPVGLVVSFTDQSGNRLGDPQSFNSPYGSAVTNGHGAGEVFSASTIFNPGQPVAESPDIASVPHQPGLSCTVRPA